MEQQTHPAGRPILKANSPYIVGIEHHEDGRITYQIEALGQRMNFTANSQEQALYAAGYNSGELAGAANMQAHYEGILREWRPAAENDLRDQIEGLQAKLKAALQREETYKQWADERADTIAKMQNALFLAGFRGESGIEQLSACMEQAARARVAHEALTLIGKAMHDHGELAPGTELPSQVVALIREVSQLREAISEANEVNTALHQRNQLCEASETARAAASYRAELMSRSNRGIAAEADALRKSEAYYRAQFEIQDGRVAAATMYADSLVDILLAELGDQLYASSGLSKVLDDLKRLLHGGTQLSVEASQTS